MHQAMSQGLGCKPVREGLSSDPISTPSAQRSLALTLDSSSRIKIISGMRNWHPKGLRGSSRVTDTVMMTSGFTPRQLVFWGPHPHPDSTFSLLGPPACEWLVRRLQPRGKSCSSVWTEISDCLWTWGKDLAGCASPLPHSPPSLILMTFDSYLYNLSYVASQSSFSQGRLHETVLTALTKGAIFNI